MSIYDMKLFSIENIRRAWDDAATRIVPLASIPPDGQRQIREYFIDILMRRTMNDDTFPQEPEIIDITPTKEDGKEI